MDLLRIFVGLAMTIFFCESLEIDDETLALLKDIKTELENLKERDERYLSLPNVSYRPDLQKLLDMLKVATSKLNDGKLQYQTSGDARLDSASSAEQQVGSSHGTPQTENEVDSYHNAPSSNVVSETKKPSTDDMLNSLKTHTTSLNRANDEDLLSSLNLLTSKLNGKKKLSDEDLLSSLNLLTSKLNGKRNRPSEEDLLTNLNLLTPSLNANSKKSSANEDLLSNLSFLTSKLNGKRNRPSEEDLLTNLNLLTASLNGNSKKSSANEDLLSSLSSLTSKLNGKPQAGGKLSDDELENEVSDEDIESLQEFYAKERKMERGLRGFLNDLTSLYKCAGENEKCGILRGKKCCDGFLCSSRGKGLCEFDCVPLGGNCTNNDRCCGSAKCTKESVFKYTCK